MAKQQILLASLLVAVLFFPTKASGTNHVQDETKGNFNCTCTSHHLSDTAEKLILISLSVGYGIVVIPLCISWALGFTGFYTSLLWIWISTWVAQVVSETVDPEQQMLLLIPVCFEIVVNILCSSFHIFELVKQKVATGRVSKVKKTEAFVWCFALLVSIVQAHMFLFHTNLYRNICKFVAALIIIGRNALFNTWELRRTPVVKLIAKEYEHFLLEAEGVDEADIPGLFASFKERAAAALPARANAVQNNN